MRLEATWSVGEDVAVHQLLHQVVHQLEEGNVNLCQLLLSDLQLAVLLLQLLDSLGGVVE